jgi:hypothetical protein
MVIIVNSYPNFLEAVCGFMALVVAANWFFCKTGKPLSPKHYAMNTLITGIYVFSRELKLHHFGGSNTYDLNDMIASVNGLLFINLVFFTISDSTSKKNRMD